MKPRSTLRLLTRIRPSIATYRTWTLKTVLLMLPVLSIVIPLSSGSLLFNRQWESKIRPATMKAQRRNATINRASGDRTFKCFQSITAYFLGRFERISYGQAFKKAIFRWLSDSRTTIQALDSVVTLQFKCHPISRSPASFMPTFRCVSKEVNWR